MRARNPSPPISDCEACFSALTEAVRCLNELGIPYCLDGGTLLGFVRDGWFIPKDYDADITTLEQHRQYPRLALLLRRSGFTFTTGRGVRYHGPPALTHKLIAYRDGAKVDIVNKRDCGGMSVWTLNHNRRVMKSMPTGFYENLGSITIRGVEFSVPQETTAYLVARFGREWRTPILVGEWRKYSMDRAYVRVRNGGEEVRDVRS